LGFRQKALGIAAFTALQRRGVPSRLLVFPNESHVVAKSANSLRRYSEVFDWMDCWSKR
jgi:dipeptidyl aminopeptidase/acylaminoacyl peptidase